MSNFSGYSLTENWFSFMAENGQKVECKHTAVYLYIVEIFNKRQWVKSIGLPTDFTMSALNIGSYKTYKKILTDLVEFGFLNIEWSRNQHTSNKIELVKNTKASSKHIPKQGESNDQSTSSINKTYKQLNKKQINIILNYFDSLSESDLKLKIEEFNSEENNTIPDKSETIDFDSLLEYLNSKTGRSFRTVNNAVKKKYKTALKQGYTKEDIKTAIDNAVKAKNHIENNFQYLTMEFFSRPEKLDMYSAKREPIKNENETAEEKELRERIEFAKSVKIH